MKKLFIVFALIFSLLVPGSAFGAIKSGSACKPLNISKISGGIKYTCVKSKGKLVWNKGVVLATPKPSNTQAVSPSPTPEATQEPSQSPTPSASMSPEVRIDVTAGAFCSPAGALGKTKTGLPVTCKTSTTDTRNRWRQ